MSKIFNVSADCRPELHYMVDLSGRLKEIKKMVDAGQYFTINRARQYGKTTTLHALTAYLKEEYVVVSLDFQIMSASKFKDENAFSIAFARMFLKEIDTDDLSGTQSVMQLKRAVSEKKEETELPELFEYLSAICGASSRPVILIIDEVDSATNNQVFLDFLAQLRGYYINRRKTAAFQSVILAGVYDVKNIRRKLRPDEDHRFNSPWNIAADFLVDMSFSTKDIAGMLEDYEQDYHIGMDIQQISELLYDYTSGYPFLVSRLCKLIDEVIAGTEEFPDKRSAWTKAGFLEAVKILLTERNTLFESLTGKLYEYPELKQMLYTLLFQGQSILYSPDNAAIDMASMFGFVKNEKGMVAVDNRIFETRLYNMFLTMPEAQKTDMYRAALQDRNQFIRQGQLDMKLILERFVTHFDDIYGDQDQKFLEEDGRRFFLLYLRPIINGTGNYYIEARTRNLERTDVIVDFHGEQYIIEMKVYRGNAYHERGERQLTDYLDYYHLKIGYMLSFNFNKKKETGVKEILLGNKVLVEAVV